MGSDGTEVRQDIHVHNFNSVLHAAVDCALPLPAPAPPALLFLLHHHHHLLPPSLKFCLAYRRCPLLAQSSERETERGPRPEPAPLILCPVHCVCQAFIQSRGPGDQEIQWVFPCLCFLQKKTKKICSSLEFCWQSRVLCVCVCVFRDLLINLCVYVVCIG